MPHLRKLSIAAHLFWKYKYKEDSLDDICQLLYVSGISVQRLSEITGKLFGGDIIRATLSTTNKKLRGRLVEWRNRTLKSRYEYVFKYWRKIRTNNCIERLNREIRRRTNVVGAFPDASSAITLVTGQLKYIVEEKWRKKYMVV